MWDLPAEQASDGRYVSLGRHGGHDLYITAADWQAGVLSDFILYTFGVAPPQMGFPTSDLPVLGTLGVNGLGGNAGQTPGEVSSSATTQIKPYRQ